VIFPPTILRVRVGRRGRRRFGCLVPLLLLWPLLLVACLVALPLAGLVALVGSRARGRRLLAAGPKTLWVFCCLRGLHVELGDADGTFLIYLK